MSYELVAQLPDADDFRALTILDLVRGEQKRSDVVRAPVATLFEALRARLAGGSKSRRPSEEVVLAVVQLAVEAVHSADRGVDAGREAYSVIRELVPHLSRDRVRRAASVLINGALRRTPPGGSGPLDVVRGLLVPALEAADENTRKNALLLVADCAPSLVGGGRGPDAAAAAAAAPATATALSLILQGSVAGLGDASYAVIAAAQKAIARLRNVDAGFGDRLRALPPEAQACVDRNADGIRQAAALLAQVSSLLGGGAAAVAPPSVAAPQGPLASPPGAAPLALAGLGVTGASVGGPGRVGPALPAVAAAPAAPPTHHGTPVRSTGGGLGGAIRIPQGTPPPQPVGATSGLFIASSTSAAVASGASAAAGTARQQWPPASSRSAIVGPSVPAVVSGPPAAFTNASTSTGSGSSVRALPFGTGFGGMPPLGAAAAPAAASVTWAAAATVIALPEVASSGQLYVDKAAPAPASKAAPGHSASAAVLPAESGGTPLVLPLSTERTSPRPGAGRRGGSPRPGAGAAGGIVVSPRHVPVGADVPLSPLESTARATMEAAAASAYASGTASSASSGDAKHATPRTRTSSVVVQTGVPVVIAGGPLARASGGGSFFQAQPAGPVATEGQPALRRVPSSDDGFVIHQQQQAGQQAQPGGITMHGSRSLSRIGSNSAPGQSPVVVNVTGGHEAAPTSDTAAATASSKPPLAPSSSALNLLASPRGTQGAAGGGNGATSRVVLEALAALSGSRAHAAVLAGMCGVAVHPSLVGAAGETPGAAAAPAPAADEGGGVGGAAGSDAMSGMGGPSIETRSTAVAALAVGLASIDSAATLAARMAGSGASLAALPAVLGLAAAAASRDPSPRVAAVGLGSVPHAAQVMRLAVPLSAAYGPISQLIQPLTERFGDVKPSLRRAAAKSFCAIATSSSSPLSTFLPRVYGLLLQTSRPVRETGLHILTRLVLSRPINQLDSREMVARTAALMADGNAKVAAAAIELVVALNAALSTVGDGSSGAPPSPSSSAGAGGTGGGAEVAWPPPAGAPLPAPPKKICDLLLQRLASAGIAAGAPPLRALETRVRAASAPFAVAYIDAEGTLHLPTDAVPAVAAPPAAAAPADASRAAATSPRAAASASQGGVSPRAAATTAAAPGTTGTASGARGGSPRPGGQTVGPGGGVSPRATTAVAPGVPPTPRGTGTGSTSPWPDTQAPPGSPRPGAAVGARGAPKVAALGIPAAPTPLAAAASALSQRAAGAAQTSPRPPPVSVPIGISVAPLTQQVTLRTSNEGARSPGAGGSDSARHGAPAPAPARRPSVGGSSAAALPPAAPRTARTSSVSIEPAAVAAAAPEPLTMQSARGLRQVGSGASDGKDDAEGAAPQASPWGERMASDGKRGDSDAEAAEVTSRTASKAPDPTQAAAQPVPPSQPPPFQRGRSDSALSNGSAVSSKSLFGKHRPLSRVASRARSVSSARSQGPAAASTPADVEQPAAKHSARRHSDAAPPRADVAAAGVANQREEEEEEAHAQADSGARVELQQHQQPPRTSRWSEHGGGGEEDAKTVDTPAHAERPPLLLPAPLVIPPPQTARRPQPPSSGPEAASAPSPLANSRRRLSSAARTASGGGAPLQPGGRTMSSERLLPLPGPAVRSSSTSDPSGLPPSSVRNRIAHSGSISSDSGAAAGRGASEQHGPLAARGTATSSTSSLQGPAASGPTLHLRNPYGAVPPSSEESKDAATERRGPPVVATVARSSSSSDPHQDAAGDGEKAEALPSQQRRPAGSLSLPSASAAAAAQLPPVSSSASSPTTPRPVLYSPRAAAIATASGDDTGSSESKTGAGDPPSQAHTSSSSARDAVAAAVPCLTSRIVPIGQAVPAAVFPASARLHHEDPVGELLTGGRGRHEPPPHLHQDALGVAPASTTPQPATHLPPAQHVSPPSQKHPQQQRGAAAAAGGAKLPQVVRIAEPSPLDGPPPAAPLPHSPAAATAAAPALHAKIHISPSQASGGAEESAAAAATRGSTSGRTSAAGKKEGSPAKDGYVAASSRKIAALARAAAQRQSAPSAASTSGRATPPLASSLGSQSGATPSPPGQQSQHHLQPLPSRRLTHDESTPEPVDPAVAVQAFTPEVHYAERATVNEPALPSPQRWGSSQVPPDAELQQQWLQQRGEIAGSPVRGGVSHHPAKAIPPLLLGAAATAAAADVSGSSGSSPSPGRSPRRLKSWSVAEINAAKAIASASEGSPRAAEADAGEMQQPQQRGATGPLSWTPQKQQPGPVTHPLDQAGAYTDGLVGKVRHLSRTHGSEAAATAASAVDFESKADDDGGAGLLQRAPVVVAVSRRTVSQQPASAASTATTTAASVSMSTGHSPTSGGGGGTAVIFARSDSSESAMAGGGGGRLTDQQLGGGSGDADTSGFSVGGPASAPPRGQLDLLKQRRSLQRGSGTGRSRRAVSAGVGGSGGVVGDADGGSATPADENSQAGGGSSELPSVASFTAVAGGGGGGGPASLPPGGGFSLNTPALNVGWRDGGAPIPSGTNRQFMGGDDDDPAAAAAGEGSGGAQDGRWPGGGLRRLKSIGRLGALSAQPALSGSGSIAAIVAAAAAAPASDQAQRLEPPQPRYPLVAPIIGSRAAAARIAASAAGGARGRPPAATEPSGVGPSSGGPPFDSWAGGGGSGSDDWADSLLSPPQPASAASASVLAPGGRRMTAGPSLPGSVRRGAVMALSNSAIAAAAGGGGSGSGSGGYVADPDDAQLAAEYGLAMPPPPLRQQHPLVGGGAKGVVARNSMGGFTLSQSPADSSDGPFSPEFRRQPSGGSSGAATQASAAPRLSSGDASSSGGGGGGTVHLPRIGSIGGSSSARATTARSQVAAVSGRDRAGSGGPGAAAGAVVVDPPASFHVPVIGAYPSSSSAPPQQQTAAVAAPAFVLPAAQQRQYSQQHQPQQQAPPQQHHLPASPRATGAAGALLSAHHEAVLAALAALPPSHSQAQQQGASPGSPPFLSPSMGGAPSPGGLGGHGPGELLHGGPGGASVGRGAGGGAGSRRSSVHQQQHLLPSLPLPGATPASASPQVTGAAPPGAAAPPAPSVSPPGGSAGSPPGLGGPASSGDPFEDRPIRPMPALPDVYTPLQSPPHAEHSPTQSPWGGGDGGGGWGGGGSGAVSGPPPPPSERLGLLHGQLGAPPPPGTALSGGIASRAGGRRRVASSSASASAAPLYDATGMATAVPGGAPSPSHMVPRVAAAAAAAGGADASQIDDGGAGSRYPPHAATAADAAIGVWGEDPPEGFEAAWGGDRDVVVPRGRTAAGAPGTAAAAGGRSTSLPSTRRRGTAGYGRAPTAAAAADASFSGGGAGGGAPDASFSSVMSGGSTCAPGEYIPSSALPPLPAPESAVRSALTDAASDSWERQFEAVNVFRRAALHHPGMLTAPGGGSTFAGALPGASALHSVVQATLASAESLRSSVAKNGLMAVADLCASLGRAADAELDAALPVLIRRAADTNVFIVEAADAALAAAVLHCSETRVVAALLTASAHKQPNIRLHAAPWLDRAVSRIPPARLGGLRDLERVVGAAARYLCEGSPEVRYAGHRLLAALRRAGAVDDRYLGRAVPERLLARVREVLAKGAPPADPFVWPAEGGGGAGSARRE